MISKKSRRSASSDYFCHLRIPKIHLNLQVTLAISIFFSYVPRIMDPYAWSDDYPAIVDSRAAALHSLKDYRPLHSLIVLGTFGHIQTIDQLWKIRFLGLMVLIIVAALLQNGTSSILGNYGSFFFAFLISQLQPLSNSVYWAMGATSLLPSITLGMLGAKYHKEKKLLASLLFILGFLIYPLGVFSGIAMSVLVATITNKNFFSFLNHYISLCLTLAISGLISLGFGKLILTILNEDPNSRTKAFSLEGLLSGLTWLVTRLLPQSLRPFFYTSPEKLIALLQAFVFFVVILASLVSSFGLRKCLERLVRISLGSILVFSPLTLLGYNQIEPRFFAGTTILLLGIVFFSLVELLNKTSSQLNKKLTHTIVSLISAGIFCSGITVNLIFYNQHVKRTFFSTNVFLENQLAPCLQRESINAIRVVERTTPWSSKPYLGMLSQATDLSSSWVPLNAVRLMINRERQNIISVEMIKNASINDGEEMCFIVLDEFKIRR